MWGFSSHTFPTRQAGSSVLNMRAWNEHRPRCNHPIDLASAFREHGGPTILPRYTHSGSYSFPASRSANQP